MTKHLNQQTKRTPEETARLKEIRGRYQRDKPTPEQLLAEGGHQHFIRLGDLMALHQMMHALKIEREGQKMTLAKLSKLTGIDQAALSRLENGKNANPTFDTVCRIASALGKEVVYQIMEAHAKRPPPKARKHLVRS